MVVQVVARQNHFAREVVLYEIRACDWSERHGWQRSVDGPSILWYQRKDR